MKLFSSLFLLTLVSSSLAQGDAECPGKRSILECYENSLRLFRWLVWCGQSGLFQIPRGKGAFIIYQMYVLFNHHLTLTRSTSPGWRPNWPVNNREASWQNQPPVCKIMNDIPKIATQCPFFSQANRFSGRTGTLGGKLYWSWLLVHWTDRSW